jgi:putative transposase
VTTADEEDRKKRRERAREMGLFRYSLVQELLEPGLSQAERGWRARELAGRVHEGPDGRRVTVSYPALGRWRRRYEEGGSTRWCRHRGSLRRGPRRRSSRWRRP